MPGTVGSQAAAPPASCTSHSWGCEPGALTAAVGACHWPGSHRRARGDTAPHLLQETHGKTPGWVTQGRGDTGVGLTQHSRDVCLLFSLSPPVIESINPFKKINKAKPLNSYLSVLPPWQHMPFPAPKGSAASSAPAPKTASEGRIAVDTGCIVIGL